MRYYVVVRQGAQIFPAAPAAAAALSSHEHDVEKTDTSDKEDENDEDVDKDCIRKNGGLDADKEDDKVERDVKESFLVRLGIPPSLLLVVEEVLVEYDKEGRR